MKQTHVQRVNYDREQTLLLQRIAMEGGRPTILIHSCCAPCSTYVLEKLADSLKVTIYFYNPNIHPKIEYERRMQAQADFIAAFNERMGKDVAFVAEPYDTSAFFSRTKGYEAEKEGSGARCAICYDLRLEETAQKAKASGIDYFASALTLSPKKNSQTINQLGYEVEQRVGVKYFPSDFKKNNGYRRSIELCQEYDVYRQCYCGCVFAAKAQGIDFRDVIARAKMAKTERQ